MRVKWRTRRSESADIRGSTTTCEAFLEGRYLDVVYDEIDAPPAWVWLSTLAHGDRTVIERAAASPRRLEERPEFACWPRTLALLARIVLQSIGESEGALLEVQRTQLTPLELSLIGSSVGPSTLARLVNSALGERRFGNPRSD